MTGLQRWTLALSNRHWSLLVTFVAAALALAYSLRGATSWFWFERGVPLLFDPDAAVGGLHLYAAHPELQIGPVTFLVAAPFVVAGAAGQLLAAVLMLACGAGIAWLVGDLVPADVRSTTTFRIALLLAAPAWVQLAVSVAHLDDALALLFATAGLWAVRRNRPYPAAAALALAVDCKPWALGFVALLLVLPHGRRLRAVAIWAGVVAAAWLPFAVADAHTLEALRFQIRISSSSVLHVVGINGPGTPPWCRAVQLVGGLLLAAFVARRHGPEAVLLVVIGVRMLLDPATHIYFDAGLAVASVIFDVLVARWRFPWLTTGVIGFVFVPGYVVLASSSAAPAVGLLRTLALGSIVFVALVPLHRFRHGSSRRGPVGPGRREGADHQPVVERGHDQGIGSSRRRG